MMKTGRLRVTTPSDTEIVMSREFDAPRHLVFEAYTKPELLRRWLGVFGGWTLEVCTVDLRVGGKFRFEWHNTSGAKMGMTAVCRELVMNEKIVSTETFDDPWYEGQAIGTVTFVEKGGKTTLTMSMQYGSKQVRDAVLQSGMETGVSASFDTLAEILAA